MSGGNNLTVYDENKSSSLYNSFDGNITTLFSDIRPDNKIYGGLDTGEILVWKTNNTRSKGSLSGRIDLHHPDYVYRLKVHEKRINVINNIPRGEYSFEQMVSGSDDGTIALFSENGGVKAKWLAHLGGVSALTSDVNNRKLLISAGKKNKTLKIWNLLTLDDESSCQCIRSIKQKYSIERMFGTDFGVVSIDEGHIKVWDFENNKVKNITISDDDKITAVSRDYHPCCYLNDLVIGTKKGVIYQVALREIQNLANK